MREFVITAHDARTDPGVSLDDLPGAGRIDLLARAVSAGLFTSHGIREAVQVHLVIQDTLTITFASDALRNAQPDERSIGGLINAALDTVPDAIGHQPAEAAPGVSIRTRGLQPTVEALADTRTVITLHEDGTTPNDVPIPDDVVFILSDHTDFTPTEHSFLETVADHRLRFSPTVLHTDHAISVAHQWLDTEGYTRF